jgi:hypothetical protein
LYWEFHEKGSKLAVRKGNWKGIKLNYEKNTGENMLLFDLSADLREEHNVAYQHPEIVAELEKIMKEAHVESEIFNFGLPIIIRYAICFYDSFVLIVFIGFSRMLQFLLSTSNFP